LAATPSVRESQGGIDYVDARGGVHRVALDGKLSEPVLSPDGKTVAFLREEPGGAHEDGPRASLWVADVATGRARRLLAPRVSPDPKANLAWFEHPVFSLDGGFVYVSADAWATSPAVHQVSVATGAERFVIDGYVSAVVRTGPWSGYLLVGRHMYYDAPREGSYNPIYVVRPDAQQKFVVPGSEIEDGDDAIAPWLKKNGWSAW
jgi:dipeptidyl aminopeptidase/acylaminoacyl peptidase